MRHFPVFLDLAGQRVVVVGAGEIAVAKLRLLLKTEADIMVVGVEPDDIVIRWADEGRLTLFARVLGACDVLNARIVYAATGDDARDENVRAIARKAGVLVNTVDNLEASDFITPAIVDRDPVTVAIGTEGAAPVLARRIKAQVEEQLSPSLGTLARHGGAFRDRAEELPMGRPRRDFWTRYYDRAGPEALEKGGETALEATLETLLDEQLHTPEDDGRVDLVGAGPGDPELLTLKARRLLHEADVVVYDRLVGAGILELARREAELIEVGKVPGGPSWKQDTINALLVEKASEGAHVVRLKSGDPLIFGRADEEIEALEEADISWSVVPGISSAMAAAASTGVSMTRRGRNQAVTLLTAHDANGFSELDWRNLAAENSVFAIYMGVRAVRFVQGRLLLHGARGGTPVTVVENASRPEEITVSGTLSNLPQVLESAGIKGPAIIFIGLSPARAVQATPELAPRAIVGAMS